MDKVIIGRGYEPFPEAQGELSEDGAALVVADYAKQQGIEAVFSAQTGEIDPSAFEGIAYGLRNLADLRRTTGAFCPLEMQHCRDCHDEFDFADIAGNANAKRACQIAAAGKHPILFVGGGNPVRPGEVALAHGGVLVIDDIAEVKPSILQLLRSPVEEKRVRIARAEGTVEYPADFILAATAKPCPCGKLGDPEAECTCPVHHVLQYRDRLCGPLADKFQLRVDVQVPFADLAAQTASSAELREGVEAAREFAAARVGRDGEAGFLPSLHLDEGAERFIERCAEEQALSGRAIHHSLAVARTIADLAQSGHVTFGHVAEALSLRMH